MKLVLGDITKVSADAIVNAANTQLKHGGGVAAAIVSTGGSIIQKESDNIGWCDIGKAVATSTGRLPAKCVIHIPTIDYTTGKKATLGDIRKSVFAVLEIAKSLDYKKVTFPLLGAGVVGLPIEDVAKTLKEAADTVPEIESILVVRSQSDYNSLKDLF